MAQEKEKKKRNYRKQIIWTVVVLTGPIWGLTLLLSLTSMGLLWVRPWWRSRLLVNGHKHGALTQIIFLLLPTVLVGVIHYGHLLACPL